MEKRELTKYIGKKVYIVLKNRFEYKLVLTVDYIKNSSLSFKDKFNRNVDFEIDDISFITESSDTGEKSD